MPWLACRGSPRACRALWGACGGGMPLPVPPCPGDQAPAPSAPDLLPRASAIPSIRAGRATSGPAACPRGPAPQRQLGRQTASKVCTIGRQATGGIPRPRGSGAGGQKTSHTCHSHSRFQRVLPSWPPPSALENRRAKIILVGIYLGKPIELCSSCAKMGSFRRRRATCSANAEWGTPTSDALRVSVICYHNNN